MNAKLKKLLEEKEILSKISKVFDRFDDFENSDEYKIILNIRNDYLPKLLKNNESKIQVQIQAEKTRKFIKKRFLFFVLIIYFFVSILLFINYKWLNNNDLSFFVVFIAIAILLVVNLFYNNKDKKIIRVLGMIFIPILVYFCSIQIPFINKMLNSEDVINKGVYIGILYTLFVGFFSI